MMQFWGRAFWVLMSKPFRSSLGLRQTFTQTYRVGLFDCEGFRVMSAFRYAAYFDYHRWEFIVRGALFDEVFLKGYSTGLISQKIVYYKPLKLWDKFSIRIETVGWDDKSVYNVQYVERKGTVCALCVSRSLIWKKGHPQVFSAIMGRAGVAELTKTPPNWVMKVFEDDRQMQAFKP